MMMVVVVVITQHSPKNEHKDSKDKKSNLRVQFF